MSLLERKITLDQRQLLDLAFWYSTIAILVVIIFSFRIKSLPTIPLVPIFMILAYLTYKNNKIALIEIKKNRKSKTINKKQNI